MRFIANGDYIMPLNAAHYWAEQAYTWSYQRGAANPDGIIRLPSRLADMFVFAACGNIFTAYFFLLSCLGIAFISFWWFARVFLGAKRQSTALLGALFYTLNPIFLGNLSKVGLILAVSMLPVMFATLKQGFVHRRLSYFWLYILALNVSLVHPFTFSVNILISGIYLTLLVRRNTTFVRDHIAKFGLIVVGALLLNAYFLLPLASLGTLDKAALSSTVSSTPVDYTKLVDIANTGDIFTGLSLSKGVLKDYEFYGARSWPFYFLGVFLFYGLLFGVYVKVEKRAKPSERQRFVVVIGLFLFLLALSTATFLRADVLLKFMISLPGGWMFRSPLKWQLYMPVLLIAALVIALKYVRNGWRIKTLYAAFGVAFVLMNGYLFTQVYQRLLTPRSFSYFNELNNTNFEHKNLLFADADVCMEFARDHPGVATELNEVFISKTVQVKHAAAAEIDHLPLAQFDYVMGCRGTLDETLLSKQYAFVPSGDFAEGTYMLFRNTQSVSYITGVVQPLQLQLANRLGSKYSLITSQLHMPFNFVLGAKAQTLGLQHVFEGLSPQSVQKGALVSSVRPLVASNQRLYVTQGTPLYYRTSSDGHIDMSPIVEKGASLAPANGKAIDLRIPAGKALELSYRDPNFTYNNLIKNASLEDGLWQKEVDDCNAYDGQAALSMKLDESLASNAKRSLLLGAMQHIACTGPENMAVKPGEHLLLSFDYQSEGDYAGYFVGFDNPDASSVSNRLEKSSTWRSFSTELVVPPDTKHLHLVVYAYPAGTPGRMGTARYDNFTLVGVPDITDRLFVVSGSSPADSTPPNVSFNKIDPTKTSIQITARQPFYLSTKESYHPDWQLNRNTGSHGLAGIFAARQSVGTHLVMNELFNGWYIDPAAICAQATTSCSHDADGTYMLNLVMEFAPQRWFYIGSLVSLIAFIGVGSYIIQDLWRHRRKGQ